MVAGIVASPHFSLTGPSGFSWIFLDPPPDFSGFFRRGHTNNIFGLLRAFGLITLTPWPLYGPLFKRAPLLAAIEALLLIFLARFFDMAAFLHTAGPS